LTDFGDRNLLLSLLAEVSKQEKNASKSFLAGIEELVNQILFVSDVPCEQICHEQIGKRGFPVKDFHHGFLFNPHHRAIGQCGRGAHAEKLPCEATFSEEIAAVQNAYRGYLPDLRHNGESYSSFLNIKDRIGRVALSKDRLFSAKSCGLPTGVDGRKECLGIEFSGFLQMKWGQVTLDTLFHAALQVSLLIQRELARLIPAFGSDVGKNLTNSSLH
jgi:hypothetical protein